MLQAAVRGALDFREAKIHDPRWWQRMRILLRQVEADSALQHIRAVHQHDLTTLVVPDLTDEIFVAARDGANQMLARIHNLLFPWEDREEESSRESFKDLRQAWIDRYGDPDDPEVAQRIQATADALKAMCVRE